MRTIWKKLRARLLSMRSSNDSLGARGEALAAAWLRRRGYRILERNLKLGDDEADVVALDPDGRTLAIVEVKTRSAGETPPEAAVTPTKQHRLSRFAARLQRRREFEAHPIRFDVVSVVWRERGKPEVHHLPAAFEATF